MGVVMGSMSSSSWHPRLMHCLSTTLPWEPSKAVFQRPSGSSLPAMKARKDGLLLVHSEQFSTRAPKSFTLGCKHLPCELPPGPSCQNSPCVGMPDAMGLSLSCSLPALAIALQERASGSSKTRIPQSATCRKLSATRASPVTPLLPAAMHCEMWSAK